MQKQTVTISAAIDVEVSFKVRGTVAKDAKIAKHIESYVRSAIKSLPKNSVLEDSVPWYERIGGETEEFLSYKPKVKVTI